MDPFKNPFKITAEPTGGGIKITIETAWGMPYGVPQYMHPDHARQLGLLPKKDVA